MSIRLPQGTRSATKPPSPPGSHSFCPFPPSLHSHETAGRKSGHLPARPRRAVLPNIALTSASPQGKTLARLPCLSWGMSCRAGSCPNAAVSSHPLSDKMSERGQSSLLNPLPVPVLSWPYGSALDVLPTTEQYREVSPRREGQGLRGCAGQRLEPGRGVCLGVCRRLAVEA